mgnify:CR=1 FL=1
MKKLKNFSAVLLLLVAANACTNDVKPVEQVDLCATPPVLVLVSSTNTSCGQSIGAITVNATGGTGNLTYSIDGGTTFQASGDFTGLGANSFTLIVNDENSCSDELQVVIGNNNGASFSLNKVDAGCGTSNGVVNVMASGGTKPYSFKLGASGTYQSDSAFTNLASGSYEIFVKDNSNCESSQTIELNSGIAFARVKSIISSNCAVSGCHNGNIFPNMTTDATIQAQASRIQARTGASTMPPSGSGFSLTQQEIDDISCWVEDGANL